MLIQVVVSFDKCFVTKLWNIQILLQEIVPKFVIQSIMTITTLPILHKSSQWHSLKDDWNWSEIFNLLRWYTFEVNDFIMGNKLWLAVHICKPGHACADACTHIFTHAYGHIYRKRERTFMIKMYSFCRLLAFW